MDKVKQLLEQRANIWEQAKALVDKAERENRDFTAREQEEYQKMLDEMDALAQRAKRLEEQGGRKLNRLARNAESLIYDTTLLDDLQAVKPLPREALAALACLLGAHSVPQA